MIADPLDVWMEIHPASKWSQVEKIQLKPYVAGVLIYARFHDKKERSKAEDVTDAMLKIKDIKVALEDGGTITKAARLLKISRGGLNTWIAELGLKGADFLNQENSVLTLLKKSSVAPIAEELALAAQQQAQTAI